LKKLYRLSFGLLAAQSAVAALFVWRFSYPARIIPFHLATALAVQTLFFYVLLIFAALPAPALAAIAITFAVTGYIVGFSLLYAIDFATNSSWGAHVNAVLLERGGAHLYGLYEVFPGLTLCVLGGFIVYTVILFVLFLRTGERLYSELSSLRSRAGILLPLVYGTLFGIAFLNSYDGYTMGWWNGEPVAALLQYDTSGFVSTPQRVALSVREKEARDNYPKNLSFEKRNIVLIVVDDLRPDRMQVYGYNRPNTPFLKSLDETGHLYKYTGDTSPCPESLCGIMSIFTSKDYAHMSHVSFGLHALLRTQGYRVSFLLSGDHHWYGLAKFYGQDIDFYRDGRSECPFGINDDRCVLQYLDELPDAGGTPQLTAFHLMSVHAVGVQLPEWKKWTPASRLRVPGIKAPSDEIENGYSNGILQADHFIEEIFRKLREKNYLNDAVVLVTADHGEGLGEHGLYGHATEPYYNLLNVPLLIFDERQSFAPDNRHASAMDIAPTICDLLGIPASDTWQGFSLRRPPPEERITVHQTTGSAPWMSLLQSQKGDLHQLIVSPSGEKLMFDLRSDPKSLLNLTGSEPARTQQMSDALEKYRSDWGLPQR